MPTFNIHAAKSQLSRLLDAAVAGEDVVIAKAGKPIVRLVPIVGTQQRRKLGTLAGKLHVPDDFDDPLPDDILADFEGRRAVYCSTPICSSGHSTNWIGYRRPYAI